MKHLIIMVRCADEIWTEAILDEEGEPTGKVTKHLGPFVDLIQSVPVSPDYDRLIEPGKAPVYCKAGVQYYLHTIDASRIMVGDYDAWADGMMGAMDTAGIVYEADTVENVGEWLTQNGFEVKPD